MNSRPVPSEPLDIAIVGAGAAGLMAAIWAGRNAPGGAIAAFDGAARIGAKILIAGGGRCNVTHDEVTADAYAGASRNAIKKVLRRFDVPETSAFFAALGVALKREETGKLFPVTDRAQTVLDALIQGVAAAGVAIHFPFRVTGITRESAADGPPADGRPAWFTLQGPEGTRRARRVILATGGRSVPKTGSDGGGYALARSLGHTLTPEVFPALVPLTLPPNHFLTELSGVTIPAEVILTDGHGRRMQSFTNSLLFTHFGLSGPGVLDISRYWIAARRADPNTQLLLNCAPAIAEAAVDEQLRAGGSSSVGKILTRLGLPDRLGRALSEMVHVPIGQPASALTREKRRALVQAITALPLPITGDRGFNYAEVTAGGVPLTEIHLETMESRQCPGLYLCGEICDVDGRIGGYNFQWAWSSGFVAGSAAAASLGL